MVVVSQRMAGGKLYLAPAGPHAARRPGPLSTSAGKRSITPENFCLSLYLAVFLPCLALPPRGGRDPFPGPACRTAGVATFGNHYGHRHLHKFYSDYIQCIKFSQILLLIIYINRKIKLTSYENAVSKSGSSSTRQRVQPQASQVKRSKEFYRNL